MPKIVDHDERRRELIAAAWRVIARDGLADTTTRSIALESGYSHGVLAHYFADKNAILDMALDQYFHQAAERIGSRVEHVHGLAALRETLLLALPVDAQSALANQVLVAFWGRAAVVEDMRERHYRGFKRWRDRVRGLVAAAADASDLRIDVDIDVATDMLVATVDGLGAHTALFPTRWSRKRLVAAVDTALVGLSADGSSGVQVQSERARKR